MLLQEVGIENNQELVNKNDSEEKGDAEEEVALPWSAVSLVFSILFAIFGTFLNVMLYIGNDCCNHKR